MQLDQMSSTNGGAPRATPNELDPWVALASTSITIAAHQLLWQRRCCSLKAQAREPAFAPTGPCRQLTQFILEGLPWAPGNTTHNQSTSS